MENGGPSFGRVKLNRRTSTKTEEATPPEPPPSKVEAPPLAAPVDHVPGKIVLRIETTRVVFALEDVVDVLGDPAAFLWWAELLARAEREAATLEANHRHQRAHAASQLAKPREWQTTTEIEAQPAWLAAQSAIADCKRNVILLREIVALLRSKLA